MGGNMGRLIKNAFSLLRGILFCYITKILCRGKVYISGGLAKYKDVSINSGKGSTLKIGRGVRLNERSTVSVLNGGQMEIGDGVGIGAANFIVSHSKIYIGADTILGPNVMIYDHDHVFDSPNGVDKKHFKTMPVSIGTNCWIGANVVILKGTTIGNRCVVGAGSVLKGEYPDDSIITQKRTTDIVAIERDKY